MSLCPEAEYRALLDDGEFWEYVFNGVKPGDPPSDREDEFDERDATAQFDPCPVCGETGPCGYDADGEPMIHLPPPGDDTEGDDDR